jgi:hypothetical protein
MENDKKIRVNMLDFKLNNAKLNTDFDLVHVHINDYSFYKDFWNFVIKMKFIAISSIRRQEYAILFEKGKFVQPKLNEKFIFTKVRFGVLNESANIYKNNIVQLFLNQLKGDGSLLPERNDTAALLVFKPKWKKTSKKELKQIYSLKISINYQNLLIASVTTFTKVQDNKNDSVVFFLNKDRGIIERDYNREHQILFKKENYYKDKNSVDFIKLENFYGFESSKVGVVNGLLNSLIENFGKYFIGKPCLRTISIISDIEKLREVNIWECFKGRNINVFFNNKEEKVRNVGTDFILHCETSDVLKANHITVRENDKSVEGLNIQVVRDARKEEVPEEYELGVRRKIIQHVTPEGFGEIDLDSKKSDLTSKPAVLNVFQNLAIKSDIVREKMNFAPSSLVTLASNYRYFYFDFSIKNKVIITRLDIKKDGEMEFTSEPISLDNPDLSTEISRVWSLIITQVPYKKRKYLFNRIDCVIKIKSDYFLILQTEMQVFPDHEEVAQRERNADVNRVMKKSKLIENLKYLQSGLKKEKVGNDYNELDVQIMIDCIEKLNGSIVSIREVVEKIKKDNRISFRKRKFRSICENLETKFGYTYNCSARQSASESFAGFKGVGLIKVDRNLYYYAGGKSNPKLTVDRAVRCRQFISLTGDDKVIKENFMSLAKLMSVPFVRNGQFTVLPFPIKYLREFIDYQKRESKRNCED